MNGSLSRALQKANSSAAGPEVTCLQSGKAGCGEGKLDAKRWETSTPACSNTAYWLYTRLSLPLICPKIESTWRRRWASAEGAAASSQQGEPTRTSATACFEGNAAASSYISNVAQISPGANFRQEPYKSRNLEKPNSSLAKLTQYQATILCYLKQNHLSLGFLIWEKEIIRDSVTTYLGELLWGCLSQGIVHSI